MTLTVDFHAHHFPTGLPDMMARTGDARWPCLTVDGQQGQIVRGEKVFRWVSAACFDVVGAPG